MWPGGAKNQNLGEQTAKQKLLLQGQGRSHSNGGQQKTPGNSPEGFPATKIFRVQRNKLDATKTITERTIAAAKVSPIILPSRSGPLVFGSKYSIICSPAASKVSFRRTLAINFKIPNGYRNNSYRNEPTYLSPGHSTKPQLQCPDEYVAIKLVVLKGNVRFGSLADISQCNRHVRIATVKADIVLQDACFSR